MVTTFCYTELAFFAIIEQNIKKQKYCIYCICKINVELRVTCLV